MSVFTQTYFFSIPMIDEGVDGAGPRRWALISRKLLLTLLTLEILLPVPIREDIFRRRIVIIYVRWCATQSAPVCFATDGVDLPYSTKRGIIIMALLVFLF
jgi:hypothetical protein